MIYLKNLHALMICFLILINGFQVVVGVYAGAYWLILNAIPLILWLSVLEIHYHPVYNLITLAIDTYHHRQSIKARQKRYALFRHRVKHGPVEFENEARDVVE